MTYLHIDDRGLSGRAPGERRIDPITEEKIHDALRAHGLAAAAQALDFQRVDLATAMRVLMMPGRRRMQRIAGVPANARDSAMDPGGTHCATLSSHT